MEARVILKMNLKTTMTHYDLLIDEDHDPVYDSEMLQQYMNRWDGDVFLQALQLCDDSVVLEIGVGTGRLAICVLNEGCKQFVGVDLSKKTIHRAQHNLESFYNYELIIGDYLTVNFKQTFDIIYSSLTFFHIEDKETAFQKTWSMLKEYGQFVLSIEKSTPNY